MAGTSHSWWFWFYQPTPLKNSIVKCGYWPEESDTRRGRLKWLIETQNKYLWSPVFLTSCQLCVKDLGVDLSAHVLWFCSDYGNGLQNNIIVLHINIIRLILNNYLFVFSQNIFKHICKVIWFCCLASIRAKMIEAYIALSTMVELFLHTKISCCEQMWFIKVE